ncbi:hypothetical protein MUK42_18112 [Musa troglodytarum]|uniref:Uncharacterized protein n=1 Tax=Musa troglodytarum TaxID=320322 RepID=A0A9E7H9E0_9LILI|nr:hypothetical protein MUK42_18112 [Musa troglodytarum]URE26057.1 hypothetical protein MUK42_18112 [Musa troglodytarum]
MASEELDRNFSELHVTRDSDCNGKSKILENQAVDGDVQITCFTEDLHDVTLHFQIIKLAKQIFVWIGCNTAKFGHLYAAAITRPNDQAAVTPILGGTSDNTGSGIARRLVLKTGLNIIVACNIPKDSPMLEPRIRNEWPLRLYKLPIGDHGVEVSTKSWVRERAVLRLAARNGFPLPKAVKVLAKNPMFARDPRHLQFEADINRLFLYTSYNRLGKNAEENDADEIIEMANKASVKDQQKQVQENIHFQIKSMCKIMDEILRVDNKIIPDPPSSIPCSQNGPRRRSGLSFAIGKGTPSASEPVVPTTQPLTRLELSQCLMDRLGYAPGIKPSQIPHEEAGQGLFLNGEADVGAIIAFYPGMIYSPAYYRCIPGYPRVDASNSYLITRYDGNVINAQPWGPGGETRELWDGFYHPQCNPDTSEETGRGSDRMWRMLSKPLEASNRGAIGEVLERRNPLAFGHVANHPPKGIAPNVMVCPYDFPLTEKDMRVYIPNLIYGDEESMTMRRFGTFWFRLGSSMDPDGDSPVLKTLVLVATRALCNEEVFLNYRLSNQKRRPAWYTPVDEEEDKRRWS